MVECGGVVSLAQLVVGVERISGLIVNCDDYFAMNDTIVFFFCC